MGITNKYELETVNYGTTGWNALNASSFQTIDDQLHTYLRYPVAAGQTISAYDPIRIVDGQWVKAYATDSFLPAQAIAIEAGTSGEYLRGQRVGPLTNSGWSWAPSGEVWLTASGELTQTKPGSNTQKVGFALTSTIIMVNPSVETDVGTGTGGDYIPTSYLTTTVGDPGSDVQVPTEQAVREALTGLVSGEYIPMSYLTTTLGDPGSDVQVPSEQAVRESLVGSSSPDELLYNDLGSVTGTSNMMYSTSGEFVRFNKVSIGVFINTNEEALDLEGRIKISQESAPAITTDRLYNVSGDLYWNGAELGAGGGGTTYSGEAIYNKTDNHTITTAELNGVFSMNAATEKTFTLPSVGSSEDGDKAIFQKLGAGKLNITSVDTDKITWMSSAPGTLFNAQADELGASVTLRYSHTITTWIIESSFGTWGTV
jgi:hypothetical protein